MHGASTSLQLGLNFDFATLISVMPDHLNLTSTCKLRVAAREPQLDPQLRFTTSPPFFHIRVLMRATGTRNNDLISSFLQSHGMKRRMPGQVEDLATKPVNVPENSITSTSTSITTDSQLGQVANQVVTELRTS